MLATAGVALVVGILTAYAQGWLPDELRSLANSVAPWALVAFLLALLAPTPALAAASGTVSLGALLAGYAVGTVALHDASSAQPVLVVWGAAAVLAGPLLGLAASWTRGHRPIRAGVGSGAVAGVLVGEGVYGLTVIAGTTYHPYWVGEMAVGVLLLVVAASRRPRHWGSAAVSALVAAGTALAFVGVYSQDVIAQL